MHLPLLTPEGSGLETTQQTCIDNEAMQENTFSTSSYTTYTWVLSANNKYIASYMEMCKSVWYQVWYTRKRLQVCS